MRKVLSTAIMALLSVAFVFSQELDWGNFENDSSIWGDDWGGSATVVANPFTTGNSSSRVLMFEPTAGWQGINHWFNLGVLNSSHKAIELDVWADSATNIQLAMVNSVDSAPEVFIRDTVIPNQWNHIVFDISELTAWDYQNIAFQNSEIVTYYFDNIIVTADSVVNDTSDMTGWTSLPIKQIVYGTVENDTDFNAHAYLRWDPDTLHMVFQVMDDSIVNAGSTYQVDNIEIYLDLNNSKRVHWPRNEVYLENDTTFDNNDYQFRLIPGKLWTDAVENKVSNSGFQYTRDSAGYTFHVSLLWDSLMKADTTTSETAHFNAIIGTEIGFDVLISDNDAIASDANRNQITWNSRTVYPYNDPSLWGTLKLDSAGLFTVVQDSVRPSTPTNVIATASGNSVSLSWDTSNDNIAVHQYIIMQGSMVVDTILALQTENNFVVSNLEIGTYTFGVIAMDVNGNSSDPGMAPAVFVSGPTNVAELENGKLTIYPNPASASISITNLKSNLANISIYNTSGQLMLKQKISNNQNISVSGLRSGLYNTVIVDNGNVIKMKLLKK